MLYALVVCMSVLLLFAVLVVRMRGLKFEARSFGEVAQDAPAEPAPEEPAVSEWQEPGYDVQDLREGETIYLETRSGTRYCFTLVDREQNLFRLLRTEHEGKRRSSVMKVFMYGRFTQGRPLIFWKENGHRGITTPVTRLLVA